MQDARCLRENIVTFSLRLKHFRLLLQLFPTLRKASQSQKEVHEAFPKEELGSDVMTLHDIMILYDIKMSLPPSP